MENKLQRVNTRIKNAAIKSGRNPSNVTIIAVTKSFPSGIWDFALQHHLTIIGESRIQEAENKNKQFNHREDIELHFIGHLQKNKARKAVQLFDVIQTIDSLKLAKQINMISKEEDKTQKIFLQTNTGNDPLKYGFSSQETIIAAKEISSMKNILMIGIMTIPPQGISKSKLRTIYKKTRKIRDKIKESIEGRCNNLSMGMSNDFEIAIAEGATHVRIGTALFGERL